VQRSRRGNDTGDEVAHRVRVPKVVRGTTDSTTGSIACWPGVDRRPAPAPIANWTRARRKRSLTKVPQDKSGVEEGVRQVFALGFAAGNDEPAQPINLLSSRRNSSTPTRLEFAASWSDSFRMDSIVKRVSLTRMERRWRKATKTASESITSQ
jgi:hypothetical protein